MQISARKTALAQHLEVEGGVLVTPARAAILELGILDLVEKTKSGQLLPITVLEAYQAKALEVDEKLNAVCDFILEAAEWAKNLESVPENERGPLYGVPVSVKECFFVKGYDATIGFAKLINMPAQQDGSIVKTLKDLHAVPFCLTNIPQTMCSYR